MTPMNYDLKRSNIPSIVPNTKFTKSLLHAAITNSHPTRQMHDIQYPAKDIITPHRKVSFCSTKPQANNFGDYANTRFHNTILNWNMFWDGQVLWQTTHRKLKKKTDSLNPMKSCAPYTAKFKCYPEDGQQTTDRTFEISAQSNV